MTDRAALIIGGSSGLGAAIAEEAVALGIECTVLGRRWSGDAPRISSVKFQQFDLASFEAEEVPRRSNGYSHVVLVAGPFLQASIECTDDALLGSMIASHLGGPIRVLREVLRSQESPIHIVAIGSVSSWRLRTAEALYCSLKAAQTTFIRNLSSELVRDRPGSRITMLHPGGLNTLVLDGKSVADDPSFLSPSIVAKLAWRLACDQVGSYREVQLMRRKPYVPDAKPLLSAGTRNPEIPVVDARDLCLERYKDAVDLA